MAGWRDNVRKVEPYVPGEQPQGRNIIKLNTNENPYPPSPEVARSIEGYSFGDLRKYPDPNVSLLREELAGYHGVDSSRVFVGVGSDDVLAMCFLTFFNGEAPLLFPDITYSFYEVWAGLYSIPYVTIPLKPDFSLDVSDYDRPACGVIIANPNAPTGLALGLGGVEDLVKMHPECVVIIDEAYVDFGAESAMSLLHKYDNLLVCRTFSKSRSMAGNRIGYAIGSRELIDALMAVRNSFNSYTIDSVSIAAGCASVRDDTWFKEHVEAIKATRERSKEEFKRLGFTFPDSSANFIFVKHESKKASDIFSALRERGIYVRYFSRPLIDNYLRVTIGTDSEMDSLFKALSEII